MKYPKLTAKDCERLANESAKNKDPMAADFWFREMIKREEKKTKKKGKS